MNQNDRTAIQAQHTIYFQGYFLDLPLLYLINFKFSDNYNKI